MEKAGRVEKSVGKLVSGILSEAGTALEACALPVYPRVVLADVLILAGDGRVAGAREANRRHALRVTAESVALGDQFGTEVRRGEGQSGRNIVACHALVRAGEQVEVVRLAGMLHGKGLREHRSIGPVGKRVDVGGRGTVDDFFVGMVLFDHHHHMVRQRDRS